MIALVVAVIALAPQGPLDADYFHILHVNGRWWFDSRRIGKLWSFAPDCVNTGSKGKPDNPAYDAHSLFPSETAWTADTLTKLKEWGFNSLGGWSDAETFRKLSIEGKRIPYIEVLHLGAYAKAPWDDLYAPKAMRQMRQAAHDLIPPLRNDPYLLGYCTDNELGWWDDTLFLSYFKMPAPAPGKKALIASLRTTYGDDFKKFKGNWNTPAADFAGLAASTVISMKPGTRGIRAVHDFNFALTTHYYSLVRHLVKAYDPAHLILGDRYCQYYNLATAEASAPYVDVVSTNDGADWLDGSYTHFMLDTLFRLTNRPVLITEFYFCAREGQSGNHNSGEGFPTVQTQAERARGFANCVRTFASLPYVVGAHWFQFYDEPPKGRGDGEDFNMGLVDVYGKPYQAMIAASAAANVERVHASGGSKPKTGIPPAPSAPLKDALLHWDRNRGYVPSSSQEQWADLYASYDRSNLYLGLVAMEFIDESLWPGGKMPETDRPTLTLRIGKWSATVRFNGKGVKAGCSDPRIEITERPGLKHTLSIRIPASALGQSTGKGKSVHVEATLSSHGHGYQMIWESLLKLN